MIEGLIIPRSYNAYINKTDAVGVLNALQLPNVMDSTPTAGSNKPVTSAGIKAAINESTADISALETAVGLLQTDVETAQGDISDIETALAGKQDELTFDNAPTSGSNNPVKSGGIKDSIDTAESNAKEWATTAYFGTTTDTGVIDITIPGLTELRQGMKIDVICPQINDVSANGLQLRINNTLSAEIKVLKNNSLQAIISHTGYWEEAATSSTRVCNANTSLTLVYNGTEWQIKGNPILCAYYSTNKGYRVYADGLIEQWGEQSGVSESAQSTATLLVAYTQNYNIVGACTARSTWYASYRDLQTLIFRTGTSTASETIRWQTMGI